MHINMRDSRRLLYFDICIGNTEMALGYVLIGLKIPIRFWFRFIFQQRLNQNLLSERKLYELQMLKIIWSLLEKKIRKYNLRLGSDDMNVSHLFW